MSPPLCIIWVMAASSASFDWGGAVKNLAEFGHAFVETVGGQQGIGEMFADGEPLRRGQVGAVGGRASRGRHLSVSPTRAASSM